jgi:hypothetical protein
LTVKDNRQTRFNKQVLLQRLTQDKVFTILNRMERSFSTVVPKVWGLFIQMVFQKNVISIFGGSLQCSGF